MNSQKTVRLSFSFRDILRAAKRNNVRLQPGATVGDYKNNGCGCVLTVLAVDNDINATYEIRDGFDPLTTAKLYGLEAGFENWCTEASGYRGILAKKYSSVYSRYEKIGHRLRTYSGY